MNSVERLRATYAFKPVDHLVRREFYIWQEALDRWVKEGMPEEARKDCSKLFGYDDAGDVGIGSLGWCEPAFVPGMTEKVLETGTEYEVIRDSAGRTLKVFKGRRHGFMPVYMKHAVANDRDWDEEIFPLLSPATPARWEKFDGHVAYVRDMMRQGRFVRQQCVGAYMYLRALVGPEDICYLFVDNPGLIHKMMKAWLGLAEAVTSRAQAQGVIYDEFFIGEDICYNHGLLISPDMVREFIFPYYQQILANIRSRQKGHPLHFQVDTDGNVGEAIDLYREIGMDVMSPFEVAAGNDLLALARKYPDLVMTGGIDKRVLAAGQAAIDDYLRRVIPAMVRRGGYVPTCDHGVPDNVPYADYLYYRKRMMELDH